MLITLWTENVVNVPKTSRQKKKVTAFTTFQSSEREKKEINSLVSVIVVMSVGLGYHRPPQHSITLRERLCWVGVFITILHHVSSTSGISIGPFGKHKWNETDNRCMEAKTKSISQKGMVLHEVATDDHSLPVLPDWFKTDWFIEAKNHMKYDFSKMDPSHIRSWFQ